MKNLGKEMTRKEMMEVKEGENFILYPPHLECQEYEATVVQNCTNHIVFSIKSTKPGFFGNPRPYNYSVRKADFGIDYHAYAI